MLWGPSQSVPKETDAMLFGLSEFMEGACHRVTADAVDLEQGAGPWASDRTGPKQYEEELKAGTVRNLLASGSGFRSA